MITAFEQKKLVRFFRRRQKVQFWQKKFLPVGVNFSESVEKTKTLKVVSRSCFWEVERSATQVMWLKAFCVVEPFQRVVDSVP